MNSLFLIPVFMIAFIILANSIGRMVTTLGEKKETPPARIKYLVRTLRLTLGTSLTLLLMVFYSIEYTQFAVFLSSLFAVIGIAFFAQWSIISNITASVIIFFSFPYRIGDLVEIIDSNVTVIGEIEDITLFHVLVRTEDDKLVTYPNSLVLQKVVTKLDKKTPDHQPKKAKVKKSIDETPA